jgi:ATP-dependent Clp protease ATP-binding subunit ClpC
VFERFTQAGRHIVILAQEEARRFGHGAIGSDHMLLAILLQPEYTEDSDSVRAADALLASGVTLAAARERVAARHTPLSEPPTALTLSADAKNGLEAVLRVALANEKTAIRATDFLLGLISKPHLSAARTLEDLGVSARAVSERVTRGD